MTLGEDNAKICINLLVKNINQVNSLAMDLVYYKSHRYL